MPRPLVLLVDDEAGILTTLAGVLSDNGYETVVTGSGREAVTLYRDRRPDVVFLDVWLPDRDGLETLAALRELDPGAAVVMISGHGTTTTAVKAIKMGAFEYLEKPLSYEQVLAAARGALKSRRAHDGSLSDSGTRMRPRSGSGGHRTPPPPLRNLRA